MLHRTLLIGLGGTGVNVLRKFKNHFLKYYDREQRYVRLLGIDTANQLDIQAPMLENHEYLHLGSPAVGSAQITQWAGRPPFRWMPTPLPAFQIADGAGQRRLVGHIAYFWRGKDIVARIQAAMNDLYSADVSREFEGIAEGGNTRVFVISSLCGGTGTGMFLDIGYLVNHLFMAQNYHTTRFGLLFLPSAFVNKPEVSGSQSIQANGYAALQELNYYMQEMIGEKKLHVPLEFEEEIDIVPKPFSVCFLLGSPDEKGKVVPDTDALYDRSAEFLFNAVAFPQIQTQLVDFLAVNGRQSYATFGSFSVPLPKARYVEKYMMKMGHELLEDVFASTAAANYADGLANVFNGGRIDQLNQVESLPPIREIDTILFSQVFIHNTPDNHKAATEAIDAEYQHWMALRGQQLQKANAESAEIVRSLEERLEEERKRIWNLDKGSLAALHTLYEATIGRIDATMVALNKGTPAQMENDIYSAYHAAQGLLNIGGKKPSDRLNAFRTELPVAARAQMAFECSSRARTLLGLLRGKLVENLAKLTRLLSEGKVTISDFDSRSVKFLGERRSGGSANLMSDAVGQSNVDSAQYDVDRIGLLQRCRAKMRLDALLDSKWSINLEHFVELLFAQTSEYVSDRVATAQLLDRKALLDGLNKAWTNLSMQQGPGTNRWVSNKLFAPRDEELRTQIREIVRDWPGFATGVEFEDPVDDSMLSFLRVVGQFPIEDITEVKQLKRAYDAKMQKEDDAFFLRLPTHRTYEVALDNQEAEKSKRYALAICSGVLADFGQAMEFAGVLQQEIADPVARRRTTREMLLNPDRYIKVQKQLEKLRKATGSNLAFADQLYDKLQVNYAADENEDPETDLDRMIAEEREQMLNYLGTLGIKKYAGGGGTN